jgi:hypothetical protein
VNSEALTGRVAGGLLTAPRGPRRADLGFRVIRRGMPSPEEEELDTGEVRRLLMPAMPPPAEEKKKAMVEGGGGEAAAAAAAAASAPRVGAGGAFIAGWGGRAETRRRGARGDKWRAGSEMGAGGREERQRSLVAGRGRGGAANRAGARWQAPGGRRGLAWHGTRLRFPPPRAEHRDSLRAPGQMARLFRTRPGRGRGLPGPWFSGVELGCCVAALIACCMPSPLGGHQWPR